MQKKNLRKNLQRFSMWCQFCGLFLWESEKAVFRFAGPDVNEEVSQYKIFQQKWGFAGRLLLGRFT